MTAADLHRAVHRTILAVWRIEQPRLITSLARMLRDVPLAEELTQDALVAALEHWPATGVPEKPGAWLMATAKRRALDHLRRTRILARKHEIVARDLEHELLLVALVLRHRKGYEAYRPLSGRGHGVRPGPAWRSNDRFPRRPR